jgi:hypothetical protein
MLEFAIPTHSFTSSPTSTDAHSPNTSSPLRKHTSISGQLSPTHFRNFHDALTFPKCAIQSSTASTDTEFSSDCGVDFPQHTRPIHVTSPSQSLLTSMIQTNKCPSAATSRSSSTSQGHAVPLTPTSSACGKPILRRDGSAPTSASEDNGSAVKGLGLAFTSCNNREEPQKRACSLKFAVRSPPSSSNRALSDSGHQINLSAARKPKPRSSRSSSVQEEDEDDLSSSHLGHHPTLAAPLEQDEEDDEEDEGYQEDSEGGFTSEEEEDYFTAPTRGRGTRSFNPSYSQYPSSPRRRISHSAEQAVIYTSTNEDCPPPPVTRGPGRQVSIADMRMKFDHCSRHISPPPLDLVRENGDGVDLEPAPPAAASPSARGLCRRRESSNIPPTNSARRQASLFGPLESNKSRPTNRSTQSDDSAFFSGPCTSILKRDPSSDRSQAQMPLSPVLRFNDRRSSEPSQCQVDEQCANGSVSPVGSEGEGQTARQGLERCLGRC